MSIFKGRLKNLNDEQGDGAISIPDAADEVRFDLKDLEHYSTPWIGEKLVFSLKPGVDGHFRAVRVKPTGTEVGKVRINHIKNREYAYVLIPFIRALIACTFSVTPFFSEFKEAFNKILEAVDDAVFTEEKYTDGPLIGQDFSLLLIDNLKQANTWEGKVF